MLKIFSLISNFHKHVQQEHPSSPNPPSYASLSYENVLGSANSALYSLGTFDLGIFTPHPGGNAVYNNTEDSYDCTAPLPIFPVYKNRLHNIPKHHDPRFIDRWPLGFSDTNWTQVWNGREHKIDQYLRQARSIYDGSMLPWTHEYDHKGAPYRLTINHHHPLDGLPMFTQGMIISFLDCNGRDNRYIIDHCTYQDDLNAYLKVICFDSDQSHFDTNSYRPPLILVVPLKFCNVRPHTTISPLLPKGPSKKYLYLLQRLFAFKKY